MLDTQAKPANPAIPIAGPIALHVLVLGSARRPSDQIERVIRARFPGSVISVQNNIRRAEEMIQESVFDLLVLVLHPLRAAHRHLLTVVAQHPMPMPTVVMVHPGNEPALHDLIDPFPPSWELLTCDKLHERVLERRILKAIENHQREWEFLHLQQAFRSSLVQYRNLFDEVPDLIFLCDRSGCLLDLNAAAARLIQKTKDQLLLKPACDVFGMSPDDFQQLLDRAMTVGEPIKDAEIEFHPSGAKSFFGLIHLLRWQVSPGRPVQFQGVIKDISPHKRLEYQLRQSEDKYKTLYELSRLCSSSLKFDEIVDQSIGLIHQCSGSSSSLLLINRPDDQLTLAAERNIGDELRNRLRIEPPRMGRDLAGRWIMAHGMHAQADPASADLNPALRDWCQAHRGGVLVGITLGRGNPALPAALLLLILPAERHDLLDQELLAGLSKTLEMGMTNCLHYANSQQAELRYRELWENAPALFISLMRGGIIFEANQTAAQALGYRLKDLIGRPLQEFMIAHDIALFDANHQRLFEEAEPSSCELRLKRADGTVITVSYHSDPVRSDAGQVISEKSVMHDITRDKLMEAQLRDYADNLERMVDARTQELTQAMNFVNGILEGSTEYAIMALDGSGTILHFNRGAQLLFGYEAARMVGAESLGLLIDFENAPWDSLETLLEAVDRQGVLVSEVPMITGDEGTLTALLTINRLKQPAHNNLTYVAIARDITEQKELEDLLKVYTENLQHMIEQKTRELNSKHIQLIQSSKLATLGEMATGIAHELNQPLSGIRTRAQLVTKVVERQGVSPERITQSQAEIIQLVDRITRIIHHMRIFARQDQQRFVPFKPTLSIEGALSLIGEQLRIHAIDVVREFDEELPLVYGESLQIEQVLLNLFSNARDAMDAHGNELRHTGGTGEPYLKLLKIRLHSVGRELCIEISDNGNGMPEDVQARIFEPFFTTKPVGRGTGLGLSISYGIITNHNGRIEVSSQPGVGTCFRVFLPIWDGSQEEARRLMRDETAPA